MRSTYSRINAADKRAGARFAQYLRGLSDEQFTEHLREAFGRWSWQDVVSAFVEFGETEESMIPLLCAIFDDPMAKQAQEARS